MSEFKNVTVVKKANVYFNGGVVSRTILFPDGTKRITITSRNLRRKRIRFRPGAMRSWSGVSVIGGPYRERLLRSMFPPGKGAASLRRIIRRLLSHYNNKKGRHPSPAFPFPQPLS